MGLCNDSDLIIDWCLDKTYKNSQFLHNDNFIIHYAYVQNKEIYAK